MAASPKATLNHKLRRLGILFVNTTYFIENIFEGFEIAYWISWITIATGLSASYFLIFSRRIFDAGKIGAYSDEKKGGTFSLAPREREPKHDLEHQPNDGLTLAMMKGNNHSESEETWFVATDLSRKGAGTAMNLWFPQFFNCFWQRLIQGRLVMTKIGISVQEGQSGSSIRKSAISLPGDTKIVTVKVSEDQPLIFRWHDLAAFQQGIIFRSVYSAHVATHFLGLGSFYAVAEGCGVIALRSEGSGLTLAGPNYSCPVSSLLAWDARQKFSLDQHINAGCFAERLSAYWFNEPSVVLRGDFKTALIDEGRPSGIRLSQRFWRLFRFSVLPF